MTSHHTRPADCRSKPEGDDPACAAAVTSAPRLEAHGLSVGYGAATICRDVTLSVPSGAFTIIIGPNGCGKSTLLRALSGLLRPSAGQVLLDGQDIARIPPRALARRIGLLPQTAEAPSGITVADLVARGRFPHQGLLRQWSDDDAAAVNEAMALTGTTDLARQQVAHLSGGQRQRVWVAMALAQETPLLLLDEPTTYMDIAHQVEVLDLMAALNDRGRTLIGVLHDLGQASRYASHLVLMKGGRIVTQGPPDAVMTEARMADVFGLDCLIARDPLTGTPMVIPRRKASAAKSPHLRKSP